MTILLNLKAEYKALTGEDVPSAGKGSSKKDKKEKKKEASKQTEPKQESAKSKDSTAETDGGAKKITR